MTPYDNNDREARPIRATGGSSSVRQGSNTNRGNGYSTHVYGGGAAAAPTTSYCRSGPPEGPLYNLDDDIESPSSRTTATTATGGLAGAAGMEMPAFDNAQQVLVRKKKMQQQKQQEKQQIWKQLACIVLSFGFMVLVLVPVFGGGSGSNNEAETSSSLAPTAAADVMTPALSPTSDAAAMKPTVADTQPSNDSTQDAPSSDTDAAPTAAPTYGPKSLGLLTLDLPSFTIEKLNNVSTPQWLAYDWLSYHPDLSSMAEWRKQQLFALATFYYAMDGIHWKEDIRNDWMLYDKSECEWWSASEEVELEEDAWLSGGGGIEPCNDEGRYQSIYLQELGISSTAEELFKPVVPPEVALLTSLQVMAITSSNITAASLNDFLPLEFYSGLSSSLQHLNLQGNKLAGPIPTQLGLLSSLESVYLSNNKLTGVIPTQVGNLAASASLQGIFLDHNSLSGVVPEDLCGLGQCLNDTDCNNTGISFDCNGQLCGCDWCNCNYLEFNFVGTTSGSTEQAAVGTSSNSSTTGGNNN